MSKELDRKCARAMGWKRIHGNLTEWYAPDGTYLRQDFDFRPSAWSDDARLLEDEIESRGLWYEYVAALLHSNDPTLIDVLQAWEQLIRATAEQRALAFLKACKVE